MSPAMSLTLATAASFSEPQSRAVTLHPRAKHPHLKTASGLCERRQSCRWEGRQGSRLQRVAFLEIYSPIPAPCWGLQGVAQHRSWRVLTAWKLCTAAWGWYTCPEHLQRDGNCCHHPPPMGPSGIARTAAPLVILEDHGRPSFIYLFLMDEKMCLLL